MTTDWVITATQRLWMYRPSIPTIQSSCFRYLSHLDMRSEWLERVRVIDGRCNDINTIWLNHSLSGPISFDSPPAVADIDVLPRRLWLLYSLDGVNRSVNVSVSQTAAVRVRTEHSCRDGSPSPQSILFPLWLHGLINALHLPAALHK